MLFSFLFFFSDYLCSICMLLPGWSVGCYGKYIVRDNVEEVSITGYSPYNRFCHFLKMR